MREALLEHLCAPGTHNALRLTVHRGRNGNIVEGLLTDEGTGAEYPILRGIPRFLRTGSASPTSNYTASFGHQWLKFDWPREEDLTEFERVVDRPLDRFDDLSILDAGCGGGRIARFLAPRAKLYIGFDYSVACERAAKLCSSAKHAHFFQADVNFLPFPSVPKFDFVFSHGVLHHSPDTKRSASHLVPLVEPGGEIYLAVFRKAILPLRLSDNAIRALFRRLPVSAQETLCERLVALQSLPFPGFFKRFFWFSMQSRPEVAKFCNFDWYAPRYHHEHTAVEVMNWLAEFGFHKIQYINAWPYCPPAEKYRIPDFASSFRLGQLVGVVGMKPSPT